jgi:DNA polymerase
LESTPAEWGIEAAEACLAVVKFGDLDALEKLWGDPLKAVAGCIRALFTAAPGHELVCADLDSIEAVVIAEVSGEEWRREVFRTHGKIYEVSASKISGVPFEEFAAYREQNDTHHPLRKMGKVAELASGFQGAFDAWVRFGADEFLTDEEIHQNVKAWRRASPSIVGLWYSLEDAARLAIQNPGLACPAMPNGAYLAPVPIIYQMHEGALHCHLPSGRDIAYQSIEIDADDQMTYMTVDKSQWRRVYTFSGKLCENVVQALARDIFVPTLVRLESVGAPVVLHTHDEVAVEVMPGTISIEDVERAMCVPDAWCADWPVRATGGWRGHRYRKD